MPRVGVSSKSKTSGNITVKSDNEITTATTQSSGTSSSVETVNNAAKYWSDIAKDWAIKTDGKVLSEDYSSKYYAGIAKDKAEEAAENVETVIQSAKDAANSAEDAANSAISAASSADTAEMYATQASTGMLWLELQEENWVLEGSEYKYELANLKAVAGVYEGSWENKKLINANVKITDDSTFIYCVEPIDGYVLCTDAVVTPEIDTAITSIVATGNIEATREGKTVTISTTTYEFEQAITSDTWTITHNLNKKPSVTVVDSANNVVEGAREYIDKNTVTIKFNGAFKGKAYLN